MTCLSLFIRPVAELGTESIKFKSTTQFTKAPGVMCKVADVILGGGGGIKG